MPDNPRFGVVAIGRNEGERLKACLRSIPGNVPVVYVDSASTDGSADFARQWGASVLDLDLSRPFTAARARNEGFAQLSREWPDLDYVQFIDSDCEIAPDWFGIAVAWLDNRPEISVVCGRRKEKYPDASFYNAMCDREWNTPIGFVDAAGGDAMVRTESFKAVDGYDATIQAHEEPDMCARMRQQGMRIERIDALMTYHDAAIMHFSQWWRRNVRGGYGYAQTSAKWGRSAFNPAAKLLERSVRWGAIIPLICLVMTVALFPWGLLAWLVYPLQIVRRGARLEGTFNERLRCAAFEQMSKFGEMRGALAFWRDRQTARTRNSISYK